ncbi:MAG: hypothetical protein AAGH88_04670 [Planctomycetota bacterium]
MSSAPPPNTNVHRAKRPLGRASTEPATGQPEPAKRKPRRSRVRTRNCSKCFTPCTTLTRYKLGPSGASQYICDICWPTYCADNKDYIYLGTWQNGRIIDRKRVDNAKTPRRPETSGAGPVAPEKASQPQASPAPSHSATPAKQTFRKRGRRTLSRLVRREGGAGSRRRE